MPAAGTVESKTHSQTGQLQTCMRFEEKAGLVQVLVDMSSDVKAQRASISARSPFGKDADIRLRPWLRH